MTSYHKSTIKLPWPLYEQVQEYGINVNEITRKAILKEIRGRQLLEKIERGELTVEATT